MPDNITIDRNLLLDIFTDGIDWSAGGFWAQVNEYKWKWWYVDTDTIPWLISPDISDDTVLMQIRDDEDGMAEEEGRAWTDITLAKLEEATKWALIQYNHLFEHYSVRKDNVIDEIDYDAIGADIVIQRIVLGEVVYG